ncbi:MAG TPA: bifunctional protein-serine/threonine kinase/phosphatase [Campylobacterales bacterium]|nr:bifunctional protein-serine/threonine kinase/phosphatase [Campylobacterales bacterium]HHS91710.1 bifunctional protein-serine/threonine kinase/phosphatase [Campylobacterales bacterium]
MSIQNIKLSGFSLAKEKELVGDDFYDMKTMDGLSIAVLCDGVGSAIEGAEAAKRVTNHLMTSFKTRPQSWSIEKSLIKFIESINTILYQESMINYESEELVTTVAVVVILGDRLYAANVGDSRIYLLRNTHLTQLSKDQAEGSMLTQAIGIAEGVTPYYFENGLEKGDRILLCSDGLYSVMSDNRLENGINNGAHFLVKQASRLMEENLPDDTTAVVIELNEINQVEILKQQVLIIPEKLTVGMEIDGYKLEKPLIQNNRTWYCSKKGQNYVLKFPVIEAKDDETLLDLFVKEAWNAKRLKAGFFPKSVIPKKRTHRYYVMKAIDGVDLKTHLKRRKLSIDDTINLAKTLLKMSQYLVQFDLVHGDIKPENIMVSERHGKLVFKIVDFGSMKELYSIDSKAGTPSYLAPERFVGASINESTEVFAIGVTLYEALTGKYPYGEIEPFQTPSFKKSTQAQKYNQNIPNWLNSILLKSISSESKKRYAHYSEMFFDITHPEKVEPYFALGTSFQEKNPVLFYRLAFTLSFMLNLILTYLLIK